MVDTIRTDAYLTGTAFPDNKGQGLTTPQNERDLIVSKVNVLDVYDDPSNAIGLGAPATIKGTISGNTVSGLTVGAGQTTIVRQNNATALQSAISAAISQNKYLETIGTIEIYSSTGLTALTSGGTGFNWHGDVADTQIIQFYPTTPGAPILTVGDVSGVNFAQNVTIDGIFLQYGAAQTGFTSANALRFGMLGWSDLRNIQIGAPTSPAPLFPAYRGIYINAGAVAAFFSNTMDNWYINGAQQECLNWTEGGTGNKAGNLYINGGGGSSQFPAVVKPINMNGNGATENTIVQLNIEWLSTNLPIDIENWKGLEILGLHMEGVKLTGFAPNMLLEANNILTIKSWTFVDMLVQSANFTGSASVLMSYVPGNSVVSIEGIGTIFNATGELNTALSLVSFLSPGSAQPTISIKGGKFDDSAGGNLVGHLSIDSHMPVSGSAFLVPTNFSSYEYGPAGSIVRRPSINVSAVYTHYGQLEDAVIILAATGTYNLTLADTMGATGNQPPRVGNTVTFLRPTYTSGTVTLKDGAGTTITTNASTATVTLHFNGTHFAVITPVT